jgi:DNA-binding LacI/PurR family transcriptional regulator
VTAGRPRSHRATRPASHSARAASHVTLADVASRLGVSRTTVSNAYNRPDQLSPDLRERVLAAAAELGYGGPDPMARSLRRGRAGSLGLVFDHRLRYMFSDPAAVLFLSGVAAGCEEAGTGLALVPQLPEGAAEVVRSALVDGYVMYCTPEDDERLQAVKARGLPHVLVEFSPYVEGPRVNIDDRGGAREVAQHLIDLGHRRFGVVLGFENEAAHAALAEELADPARPSAHVRWRCYNRHERLLGWHEAIGPAGVDWSAVPVASAPDGGEETGDRAAATLLDRADRPTAILCGSDLMALGALRAAAERGIAVPQELSVVGFDDVPAAAAAGLTTVNQPHVRKGEEAVRLLTAGGPDVLLPTNLVVRASSGPAPS